MGMGRGMMLAGALAAAGLRRQGGPPAKSKVF